MLTYRVLRRILLALTLGDVELASNFVLSMLDRRGAEKLVKKIAPRFSDARLRQEFFGCTFENPVGLAAGLTKDFRALRALQEFGFGFIEGGGVTPVAQPGNEDGPRFWDLSSDHALINAFEFPSLGQGHVGHKIIKVMDSLRIPLGINLAVNKDNAEDVDRAIADYQSVMETIYPFVHFGVVNISSPNTKDLHKLGQFARVIVPAMRAKSSELAQKYGVPRKKVFYKLGGDMSFRLFGEILGAIVELGGDGVVIINTTTSRGSLLTRNFPKKGGLSGPPLFLLARDRAMFAREFSEDLFIIGVGGISGPQGAIEILPYVNLIQVLTGFATHDPFIAPRINRGIVEFMAREQMTSIADFRQFWR